MIIRSELRDQRGWVGTWTEGDCGRMRVPFSERARSGQRSPRRLARIRIGAAAKLE